MQQLHKFDWIDVLRGLAILLVIMVHSSQYYGIVGIPNIDYALGNGMYGVQLFFIASSFTLFYSYQQRKTREKKVCSNFLIRRFFRIAPLYYLGIVFYYSVNHKWTTFGELLANLFFINDVFPLWINRLVPGGWSIAVEMSFYLCIPFLVKYIKTLNSAVCCFVVSIIVNALLHYLMINVNVSIDPRWIYTEFLYYWLPNQFPVFILGVILYFIVIDKCSLRDISPILGIIVMIMFFFVRFLGINCLFFKNHLYALLFVFFAFFLSKVSIHQFIKNTIGKIGKLSFSMYLMHFVVLSLFAKYNIIINIVSIDLFNYLIYYCFVLVVTIALSIVTYYFIELNGQKIGGNLIRKRECCQK